MVIVVYPGVQVLDVVGPLEVFAVANRFADGPPPYGIEVAAATTEPLRTSGGLAIVPDRRLGRPSSRRNRAIDTLVVAGGEGTETAVFDPALRSWIQAVAPHCRRVVSVCSGAFLLAAAGLLDGKHATTHWSECHALEQYFPKVIVEPDPIFVRDGAVATSAGITAGIDLALALVEEDCGREVALQVARWLVVFLRRPGGQSQFSAQLDAQMAERDELADLQAWIVDHPDADLTVAALAARAGMSERNFTRVFAREVGATPADYVERVRVETARRLLETTGLAVAEVARRCGYANPDTFQRAFVRQLGVTPRDYRRRFVGPTPQEHR